MVSNGIDVYLGCTWPLGELCMHSKPSCVALLAA